MKAQDILSRTASDLQPNLSDSLIEKIETARHDGNEAELIHKLESYFVRNAEGLYRSSKSTRHYTARRNYLTRLLEIYHATTFLLQPEEDTEPEHPSGEEDELEEMMA